MDVMYQTGPRRVDVPCLGWLDCMFFGFISAGLGCIAVGVLLGFGYLGGNAAAQTSPYLWQGLVVEPESDCGKPYKRYAKVYDSYERDKGLEHRILVQQQGRIYSPYDGRSFSSLKDTDIEHIVARSEAHESGLCRQSKQAKRSFVTDLHNLALATPDVNQHDKRDLDFGQWQPEKNKCWMAHRVIEVKRLYSLSIDERERHALETALCSDPRMI